MPPRWPRQPDRNDPAYRKLDDRMNFAVHVAIFALANSGVWFFRIFGETADLGGAFSLPWAPLLTAGWASVLAGHGIFIFAIAKYEDTSLTGNTESGIGFKPAMEKKAVEKKTSDKKTPVKKPDDKKVTNKKSADKKAPEPKSAKTAKK